MTENTPSVPDSAALAKEIIQRFDNVGDGELSLPDHQWLIQQITRAIENFGRAQYDRGQAVGYERGKRDANG